MATANELLKAGKFPKHLPLRYFDHDAPVPPRMADSSNWMNEGGMLDEPIYVRTGTGVYPITNLIHLQRLLDEDGGLIVPKPQPAA